MRGSLKKCKKRAHLVKLANTIDLKSVPFLGYRFKSDSEHGVINLNHVENTETWKNQPSPINLFRFYPAPTLEKKVQEKVSLLKRVAFGEKHPFWGVTLHSTKACLCQQHFPAQFAAAHATWQLWAKSGFFPVVCAA